MTTATSVAASAVVASPSIALEIIPSGTPSPTDAKLLRLGAEFDRLRDAMLIAEAENNRLLEAAHAPIEALRHDHEAFAAALEKLDDSKIPGFPKVDGLLKEISEQIDRVLKSMIEIPPASFSGVAVKLRAMRWLTGFDEDTPDAAQDWGEEWFNAIDRDVRRLAGEDVTRSAGSYGLPLAAEPSERDPVFDAIDAQRHATAQLDEYFRLDEDLHDEDVIGDLRDKEISAIDALFRTLPTTQAGCEALIQHAIRMIDMESCGDRDENTTDVTAGQLIALLKNLSVPIARAASALPAVKAA